MKLLAHQCAEKNVLIFEFFYTMYNEYQVLSHYALKKFLRHLNLTRYDPCHIYSTGH